MNNSAQEIAFADEENRLDLELVFFDFAISYNKAKKRKVRNKYRGNNETTAIQAAFDELMQKAVDGDTPSMKLISQIEQNIFNNLNQIQTAKTESVALPEWSTTNVVLANVEIYDEKNANENTELLS